MRNPVLRWLRPTLAVLFGLTLALPAQDGPPTRLQPEAPGWQDQVNTVFGTLLGWGSAVPFYDIAPFMGIDGSPKLRRDDDGNARTDSLAFGPHDGPVTFAAFGGDGRRVLTVDGRHQVRVWSLFRARWRANDAAAPDPLLAVLRGHTGPVVTLATFPLPAARVQFTDDFYRRAEILTASQDGTVRLWRLCTDAEVEANAPAPTTPVTRDARMVLLHGAPIVQASYSPTGRWIASAGDGVVIVWDEKGAPAHRFQDQQGGFVAFAFAGDDRLAIVDGQGRTRVYPLTGGQPVTFELTHQNAPFLPTAVHSTDGALVVTDAAGRWAEIRSDADGTQVMLVQDPGPAGDSPPTVVAVSNGVAVLTTGGSDLVLGDHTAPVRGASLEDSGNRGLTWSEDGTARVWEWLVRGPTDNLATVGVPFVVLWLVIAAVLFTLFFRFVNFRMFKHAIHCVAGRFSDPGDKGEVSHFQALSAALSATVGLGNIAGVAIAVMIGGPGATFWMIVAGFLGMTLKFTECTLGQKFRKIDEHGVVSGGPMHYLKDGFAQRGLGLIGVPLAVIFSLFCIGGAIAGGNAFQVNQSLGILQGQVPFFADFPWVYGLLMAFFVGIVIIGGIRSIARVADKIVPTMCSLYVLSALVVILMHLGDVPQAIGRIFSSALSGDAMYGGAIGALIMGFRRAAFSNEAGVGSASIAHSAARTPYAVREGIVALLEPFIDTVVVCTMTALVIGITGVYSAPEHAEIVASTNGAALTAEAFKSVGFFSGWFPWLLMIAVTLFAYSTMISWSYYGERCATNLFGPKASLPFKALFLAFTVLGSIVTAQNVLDFGDLMILLMAFPNIIGLYFLGHLVKRDLKDYEQKLASGEIKAFR